jgi:hypothetical protein
MDNVITLICTVQDPREGFTNPRVISEKFVSSNVIVASEKGKAFLDVVASNGTSELLKGFAPGETFQAIGRLDSHRGTDNRWRLRFWADNIEPLPVGES